MNDHELKKQLLHRELDLLRRQYELACKPIIDKLVEIEAMRLPDIFVWRDTSEPLKPWPGTPD